MEPTPQAQRAMRAIAITNILATLSLEKALDALRTGSADAHIAFGHTADALQALARLGEAQALINAMRGNGGSELCATNHPAETNAANAANKSAPQTAWTLGSCRKI